MEIIDLGLGYPAETLLPLEELRQAALHRLALPDRSLLQYAPEAGNASFRQALANFLTRGYGVPVSMESLLVAAGASHGLDLILCQLSQPGDTIFVEDPTYFCALDILRDRRLRIVPIATDHDGLDIDALEQQLQIERPKFLYTIPIFQNPTGTILPTERRQRLVELARRYNFLIIADEVYQLLGERGSIPPPLATFDEQRVLSLGSFSKILGPGIRVGWVQCTPEFIANFRTNGLLLSGGGMNPFTAAIVESTLELGLQDAFLPRLREHYAVRRELMIQALTEVLPSGATFLAPSGGFFVWIELPAGIDATELSKAALTLGLGFRAGALFSGTGNFTNCLRLCFAFYDQAALRLGCERLGTLLHSYL